MILNSCDGEKEKEKVKETVFLHGFRRNKSSIYNFIAESLVTVESSTNPRFELVASFEIASNFRRPERRGRDDNVRSEEVDEDCKYDNDRCLNCLVLVESDEKKITR
jgi:hypothetical protein